MKYSFTLFFLTLFFTASFAQIEWAETGCSWYIRGSSVFGPPHYLTFSVTKDTVVQGKDCRIIESNNPIITFFENNQVFIFSPADQEFQLVMDFAKMPGESWQVAKTFYGPMTVWVDSLTTTEMEGLTIPTQCVSYYDTLGTFFYNEKIFKGIGSSNSLLPFLYYSLEGGLGPLCSYSSPSLGIIVFDSVYCSFSQSIEVSQSYDFSVFPNPFHHEFHLKFHLPEKTTVSATLLDLLGKEATVLLENEKLPAGEHERELSLGKIPKGHYLLRFQAEGRSVFKRVTKI